VVTKYSFKQQKKKIKSAVVAFRCFEEDKEMLRIIGYGSLNAAMDIVFDKIREDLYETAEKMKKEWKRKLREKEKAILQKSEYERQRRIIQTEV
jgi:glycine cleavage system pyridoxal-binding protein P